ncbi:hypothetical protein [Nocardia colli]|uniref:hypothetical protein n=1 Tax=Nocardia colli TaxID=2545717 RepID=UPI0035DA1076
MIHTESVSTDQLNTGDVVYNHGMRLVIDQEITSCPGTGNNTIYRTSARIDNWAEMVERAESDPTIAGFIVRQSPQQRWVIQGNELARWGREIRV